MRQLTHRNLEESAMLKIILGIAIASVMISASQVGISSANAQEKQWTCQMRANVCVKRGGGPACTEPSRMARCRSTGTYTAPSGNVWPVSIRR